MKITSKVFRPLIPHKGTPSWKWRAFPYPNSSFTSAFNWFPIHSKPGGCFLPHVPHHSVFSGISLSENLYPESSPPLIYSTHGNHIVFSDACLSFLGALTLPSLSFMIMKVVFKIILTSKRRIPHEHKYQAPCFPTSLLSQWGIALPSPITFSGDKLDLVVYFSCNWTTCLDFWIPIDRAFLIPRDMCTCSASNISINRKLDNIPSSISTPHCSWSIETARSRPSD